MNIPDLPDDSAIQIEPLDDGIRLSWLARAFGRSARTVVRMGTAIWMVACGLFALIGVTVLVVMIVKSPDEMSYLILLFVVGFLLLVSISWALPAYRIYCLMGVSDDPDQLDLFHDRLTYRPASGLARVLLAIRKPGGALKLLFRKKTDLEHTFPRAEVTFDSHTHGDLMVLYLQLGPGRYPIGIGLSKSDQEWLHVVLDQWRGAE
jgi:hypothetical protein